MTSRTQFISGRTGRGSAYVSDRSGVAHDRFMRFTSRLLLPLGVAAAFLVAALLDNSAETAVIAVGNPMAGLALIAFILIGMAHARTGAESIIIDYVHEEKAKALADKANTIVAILIAAAWTLGLGLMTLGLVLPALRPADAAAAVSDEHRPVDWESWHAGNRVADAASLQRGAHIFMNYCIGCHSLKYMRDQRQVRRYLAEPVDGIGRRTCR